MPNTALIDDLYRDYYSVFEEIRKRKIDPAQLVEDYGSHSPFVLNYTVPVVVKNNGEKLDELAQELGFESADSLYNHLMSYFPKYKRQQEMDKEWSKYYGQTEGVLDIQ